MTPYMMDFLKQNYLLLVLMIGFLIIVYNSPINLKKEFHTLWIIVLSEIVLLILDELALVNASMSTPTYGHNVIAALGFGLRPFAMLVCTWIAMEGKLARRLLSIPWILNAIIYSTAVFQPMYITNPIAFSILENNTFVEGPWIYTSTVVTSFYMFSVAVILYYKYRSMERKQTLIPMFGIVVSIIAALLELTTHTNEILNPTIMIVCIVFYGFMYMKHTQEETIRKEKLLHEREKEVIQSRIDLMRSQIQPHFMFNTLSVISSVCLDDPELAREILHDFSNYLRMNIRSLDKVEMIPFEKELQHVNTYLLIEEQRFGNRLNVEYEIDCEDFSLPMLTLQPLVENAVKHGVCKKLEGGTVCLTSWEDKDRYLIEISDDGIGFNTEILKEEKNKFTGIENVRRRIEHMCQGTLEIQSVDGEGTKVLLSIPRSC